MSSSFTLKLITTEKYHLWNDALHARKLASETADDWYRGTYIRWTVTTAWTVMEKCCGEALDVEIRDFQKDINKSITKSGLKVIDWKNGTWKNVSDLKDKRNDYAHLKIQQEELWPKLEVAEVAEDAIKIVREAVQDIYVRANKAVPSWISDNDSQGWK